MAALVPFDDWAASQGARIGPPGSKSILTPLAARELWDREGGGGDALDAQQLAKVDA
eukprot:CAMPEP_0119293720 /NCGR_PEP_ID=MMETSP1329-20130426/46595_1 /TAXON_ID=114041 /ORGANISM="Genus nov. species nov., Strain RCC1024" /LENGTH=56 /DNA_ID=CAMNT_0007294591 /DNA_START=144 /DNA_END=311 /DNA_ORIENTATION=+